MAVIDFGDDLARLIAFLADAYATTPTTLIDTAVRSHSAAMDGRELGRGRPVGCL